MLIMVACEESQAVTKAFRALGHSAWSFDVQPCSGDRPDWHIQGDCTPWLSRPWDMIIAFPPCTHLSSVNSRYHAIKIADGRRFQGIEFFSRFILQTDHVPRVAIENPVGIMSSHWRKPDQIIQPYWFGDRAQKRTCLWLKGLPPLTATEMVDKGEMITVGKMTTPLWFYTAGMNHKDRAKIRSKTFAGVARAMAQQWGGPCAVPRR